MNEAVIHLHPPGRLAALVGNPNAGKTALFNRLTGSNQKVANYAGVTIERKEGRLALRVGQDGARAGPAGHLQPESALARRAHHLRRAARHRARARSVPTWWCASSMPPTCDAACAWCSACKRMGLPCVVALNMVDLAASRGIRIDTDALAARTRACRW